MDKQMMDQHADVSMRCWPWKPYMHMHPNPYVLEICSLYSRSSLRCVQPMRSHEPPPCGLPTPQENVTLPSSWCLVNENLSDHSRKAVTATLQSLLRSGQVVSSQWDHKKHLSTDRPTLKTIPNTDPIASPSLSLSLCALFLSQNINGSSLQPSLINRSHCCQAACG